MRHAERHRALWAPLLEAPGFERELGIMEALAVKMASAVPAGASRQTDEQGWPLRNLDELYAQAEDVDPVFGAKVAHWASVSYAEPMPAAELKRPRRAMQKVHRVYNGDASRLRDLSRRALIFRDVSRMRRCLEAIHRDEDVEVRLADFERQTAELAHETALIRRFEAFTTTPMAVPVVSVDASVGAQIARLRRFWRNMREWDGRVQELLLSPPDRIRINQVAQGTGAASLARRRGTILR